jgi:hypothetical protein
MRGSFSPFSPPHRTYGKKFVTAGITPQRRHTEHSPKNGRRTRHMLRGDVLQFEVAANPAVRINDVAKP